MPTLLRWKGYRFFFYSADGWEPPHVHVAKDGKEAKVWLNDLGVAVSLGYLPANSARSFGRLAIARGLSGGMSYFANRG